MSSYINSRHACRDPNGKLHVDSQTDWRAITWDHLAFCHGPDRAQAIMDGKDAATQADLTAWRNLGRRSAA